LFHERFYCPALPAADHGALRVMACSRTLKSLAYASANFTARFALWRERFKKPGICQCLKPTARFASRRVQERFQNLAFASV
jgi:hypothetical protein